MESVPVALETGRSQEKIIRVVSDYDAPDVSDKVLKIILSYTDFINRRVWCKYE
jgi:UDP-N-acetyl-L-fucosamine synthase